MAPVSKLSDVIRKATRAEASRRLGFGTAAAPRPAPSLLCLVHLSAGDSHKVAEAVSQGADAVILDGADPGKVKDQIRKAEKSVLGVRLGGKADRSAVAAQHEAGADFVVLEPDSAAAEALLEDGLGVVLSLGRDLPDMTLRLLGDLSPDALLAPPPDEPLTVARSLELRRLSSLARAPLLVEVSPSSSVPYLQALREAGVAGVIIEGRAIDKLGSLRETIESLPARGRRREERGEAMLPVSAAVSGDDEDEDDEDDFP